MRDASIARSTEASWRYVGHANAPADDEQRRARPAPSQARRDSPPRATARSMEEVPEITPAARASAVPCLNGQIPARMRNRDVPVRGTDVRRTRTDVREREAEDSGNEDRGGQDSQDVRTSGPLACRPASSLSSSFLYRRILIFADEREPRRVRARAVPAVIVVRQVVEDHASRRGVTRARQPPRRLKTTKPGVSVYRYVASAPSEQPRLHLRECLTGLDQASALHETEIGGRAVEEAGDVGAAPAGRRCGRPTDRRAQAILRGRGGDDGFGPERLHARFPLQSQHAHHRRHPAQVDVVSVAAVGERDVGVADPRRGPGAPARRPRRPGCARARR